MSEKLRKIKDRASKLHAEGKVKDALKLYEQVVAEDPSEIQCRLKVGDLYKRLGQREAAVKAYEPVARHYAEDGLLLKAIAVCKMILAADPNHAGTQAMLTQLHGKRRAPPTTSGIPLKAAPPRPLMSEAEVLERSFGIVPSERPRPATNDDEEMVIERTSRPSVATKATIPVSPPAPQSPLPASSWPPRPPVAAGPGDVPKSTPSWPVTPNVVQGAPASAPS